MQKWRPDDAKFASQLGTLARDGTFRSLNDATKTAVLDQVSKYAGDPRKIDNLTTQVTSPSFDQLSNAEQKKMMDALAKSPDDAQLAEGLGKLSGSTAYRASKDLGSGVVLEDAKQNPAAVRKIQAAKKEFTAPNFGSDSGSKTVTYYRLDPESFIVYFVKATRNADGSVTVSKTSLHETR